ncbi:somatostatin receptor type 2-like [Patiria miniata]|uniref:G-protein coupled receptors family 1 profile domain-containing protein n=1 Tax=Patiria miniata TaxID=46514 RepID=A0A914BDG9_PATMI|nr:somatostatin receptor type 2-like [Patiria miniata]
MATEKTSSIMLTTTGYTEALSSVMAMNGSNSSQPATPDYFIMDLQRVMFIVTCILCSMGLLCNGFIIVILIRFPNMKTLANNFILNLALADFFFMVTFLFLSHQLKTGRWVFGAFLCRIIVPYDAMTQFLVIDFVMIMSIDRYFAICLPIKSMNFRTLRNGRITSAVIWLVAMLSTLPLWIYTVHICQNGSCLCLAGVSSSHNPADNRWWNIYTIIIGFCVPLIIICICYLLILHQLLRNPMQDSKNSSRRAARRVAILVICIIIVFILCFLPFYVVQFVLSTLEETNNIIAMVYVVTWSLMYSHSIINPIVYTLVGENFRKNIGFIFCKRSRNTMYSRQSSMRTSSFHTRRTRNSLKSTNSNDPTGLRPHNGYYVHLDTGQHRGAREDPV